jgi:hypothetical protein
MKRSSILVVTSLLLILLSMVHLADDISRGLSPARFSNLPVVLVAAVWLYATLVLAERRSGHAVILVMSLLASGLPVIHMTGRSGITGGAAAGSAGALFFALTLLVLGVTAVFSVILSARGLWSLRRGQPS